MKTRKLWLSLSAAAVSSTMGPAQAATFSFPQEEPMPSAAARATRIQVAQAHVHGDGKPGDGKPAVSGGVAINNGAGAGGESGEGSAGKVDADARLEPTLRFYRDVQLVRGHILVGNELVKAGLWADALPHFLHPVEELYDGLATPIKTRKVKPFLQQLKALAQTVKAKNGSAYEAALAALNAKLDLIDANVKVEKTDWMPFAVETALETLKSSLGEYTESIADGRFAKAVEYQDSRGFVFQADRLISSVAVSLTEKDPKVAAKMRSGLDELKSAWPTPVPPAAVVHDASQVAAMISKLELALGNVK